MDLIRLLPNEELDRVHVMRKEYSPSGTGAFDEYILREWEFQKHDLYKLFGEQFEVSFPVEVKPSIDEMWERFRKSWEYREFVPYTCVDGLEGAVERYLMAYHPEISFIDTDIYGGLWRLLDKDSLMTNKYEGRPFEIPTKEGKSLKINRGCKTLRALGQICNLVGYKNNEFENFRIKHSQILNDAKIKGEIILSILPSDYMTASVNNNNWSSCMNWDAGDYCQGTVEMMNSPYVLVAEMDSSDSMWLSGIEFKNKKWREFFIITSDVITAIKGYPYWNRELEIAVIEKLRELAAKNWEITYSDSIYFSSSDSRNDLFNEDGSIRFVYSTDKMYNDIYSNHYICTREGLDPGKYYIHYSGQSECMDCGRITDSIDTCSLSCDDCRNDVAFCASCGCRIYLDDDDSYYVNGNYYCGYCIDEYFTTCDSCDAYVNNDDIIICEFYRENKYVGTMRLCENCMENLSQYYENDDNTYYLDKPKMPEENIPGYIKRRLSYSLVD